MADEGFLTIGKVVKRLQAQYPELSVSKVRYLEEEGLVTPRRTPGGYRLYSQRDIDRLERILHLQKTRFLPLAVIRGMLERDEEAGRERASRREAPEPAASESGGGRRAPREERAPEPVAAPEPEADVPADAVERDPVLADAEVLEKLHPIDRVPDLMGVSISFVRQLSEAGIVELKRSPHGRDLVEGRDLALIRTADELRRLGIAPKNLRQYVNAANRESGMFEQALVAYAGRGEADEEHRRRVAEAFSSMLALTNALRDRLIRRAVGERFKGLDA